MDAVIAVINEKKTERGISLAELARRVGMEYDALYQALSGNRNIKAEEFIALCKELGLTISDFETRIAI